MAITRGQACPWIVAALLSLAPGRAFSAGGTEAASFLSIPTGGRPAALGGAYSALANDAYAPVWNPAGLTGLKATELAGMHLDYLGSVGYEFVSFAQPLGAKHGVGGAVSYLHPKSVIERDANGAELGTFSSHYAAYTLAFGHAFNEAFSLGASGKVVDARIADAHGQALAADLGGLYRHDARLRLAVVAANLGTKLTLLEEGDALPASYRFGVLFSPVAAWSLAAETGYAAEGEGLARLGAEWRPLPALAVRGGYRSDSTRHVPGLTGLTAGVGLTAYGQRFDYAWTPMGDLGDAQSFSVVFTFGGAAKHE